MRRRGARKGGVRVPLLYWGGERASKLLSRHGQLCRPSAWRESEKRNPYPLSDFLPKPIYLTSLEVIPTLAPNKLPRSQIGKTFFTDTRSYVAKRIAKLLRFVGCDDNEIVRDGRDLKPIECV